MRSFAGNAVASVRARRAVLLLGASAFALGSILQANAAVIDYPDGSTRASPIVLTDNSTQLQVVTGSATQTGAISGAFRFEKIGAGLLTLAQINTYSGGTLVTAGTLRAGEFALGQTGTTITLNGGTLKMEGTLANHPLFLGASGGTIDTNGGTNIDSIISGTGALTLTGGTTLFLSSVSTYTGGTIINAGTSLVLTNNGALVPTGAVTLNSGNFDISSITAAGTTIGSLAGNGGTVALGAKTLTVGDSSSTTFAGNITGAGGALIKQGTGTLILSGANTYNGGTTFAGGTLNVGSAGAIGTSGTLSFSGGTLQFSAANTTDYSARFSAAASQAYSIDTNSQNVTLATALTSSSGTLAKLGAGTLILTGANTYSGGTTISAGTLQIGNGGTLGTGPVTDNGTLSFNRNISALVVANAISGSGALTQSGVAQIYLSGTNTYTGVTSIASNSALYIGNGGTTGTLGTGAVTNNGTLLFNRSDAVTLANVISGSGGLFTTFNAGPLTLTGTNSYTGTTSIESGTSVALSGAGSIAASANIFLNANATFDISAASSAVGVNQLTGSGAVVLGATTLTATYATAGTLGGVISGTGGFTKAGPDTLTLTGANTYTGATLISAGTLALSGTGTIATSSSVTDNGAFDISAAAGGITVNQLTGTGNVVLGANTLTANNAAAGTLSGVISGSGGFTKAGAGVTILTGNNNYNGATSATAGVLQIGAGGTSGAIGAGAVALSNNALIAFNRSDATTIANVISGAGRVTIGGTGIVTLTGINTYANGTIISSGATVQVGNGGTTGSLGSGAITDNGTLAFNRSDAMSLPSGISGSGGISQLGSGALSITTAQTYTGATAIAAGSSLVLTGAGDISASSGLADNGTFDISGITAASTSIKTLSGTGTIALGTKRILVSAGTGSFSGSFTGTGTVELSGGTTTLTSSEDNNFQVDSGATLQVGNGGTAGAVTGNIVDNGALAFNRSDSVTAPGVISGTGALMQIGTGTTILTGANSYSGVTTISAGTLQVGAGGTAGSLGSGAVTDNGTLAFNRSDSVTIANAISGTGAVTKAGAGIITLTGANSYSGATIITAGTLQVGTGGTAGSIGSGAITDNGALVFNRSDALTVANAISGTGTLTQNGSGNLILGGTSSYTGVTTINAGTLSVNGSIASSNVVVNNGGKLGGNGTVGGVTVLSGGTIAPGNSIGTINVASLSLAPGSAFTAEVSPTAADRINVTGAATLNGTLALVQTGGTYTANTYRLIQAGSLTGTFATVTGGTFTGLNSTVQYSATAVDLILAAPVAATPVTPPTVTFLFNTYGTTPNQVAAGAALTTAAPTSALYVAAGGLVGANTAGVPAALGQISGDIHASLRSAAVEDSRIIRDTVLDHLNNRGEGIVAWGAGFGGYGSISTDGNAAGLHHDSAGFIVGADMAVGDGFRLGLAGGYTANNASVTGKASTATGNSGHVIAYGGWSDGAIDLKLGGDFGFGNVQVTRSLAAFGQTNTDRQDQRLAQVFGEAGYRFETQYAMLEPFAGIASISATTGGFAETGGTTALTGGERTDTQTYSTVGLRASLAPLSLDASLGGITPHVDMGWQHGFRTLRPGQVVAIAGIAQGFTVLGVPLASDAAAVRAGFDMAVTPEAVLSLDYDGSFANRVQNNAIRGTLQWKF